MPSAQPLPRGSLRPLGKDGAQQLALVLRHRLLPFLGEAFGGCASLPRVCVHGYAGDLPVSPDKYKAIDGVHLRVSGTAGQTAALSDEGENDPVAKVGDLLKVVFRFLIGAQPISQEASNCRTP